MTISDAARRQVEGQAKDDQNRLATTAGTVEQLAVIEGLEFDNGVIGPRSPERRCPARPRAPVASSASRSGCRADLRTYDAFYLRPTNGRADDQVRRNHAVQYISHPDWPWFRLRKETPEKYESYVDLVPGQWTKVKIEVRGAQARLYVHNQPQPTLIVNDVKTGATAKGAVALWLDIGTVAHFRHLTVTRSRPEQFRKLEDALEGADRLRRISTARAGAATALSKASRAKCHQLHRALRWR